jgi:hypothetical protein
MDIEALLAELLTKFTADRDGVFKLVHTKAQPLFQAIFDRGRREERKLLKAEKEANEKRAKELEDQVADLEEQVEKASKGQPDLAAEVTRLKAELAKVKTDHKAELDRMKADNEATTVNLKAGEIEKLLIAKGVEPLYAKTLVKDEDFKKRLKLVNGELEVMQPKGDTPYVPAEGESVIDLVVTELYETVPDRLRNVDVDAGSGTQTRTTQGGAPKKGLEALREKIEAERKREREAGQQGATKSLEEKLGMVPAAS